MRLSILSPLLPIARRWSARSITGYSQHNRLAGRQPVIRHTVRASAIALMAGATLFAGAVQSETFGVRVTDVQGQPMAGVAVCFGMQGNYKRFGTRFTDDSGTAMLDVPNVPLVVTVSKNRFTGTRLIEPARRFALIKEVRLQEGVPGPRCKADSSLASMPDVPAMQVREIAITGAATSRRLRPVVNGSPSHYRIGSSPNLAEVGWQPYAEEIVLSSDHSSQPQLYLQLRNRVGSERSWIESVSNVITIVIPGT